MTKQELAQKIKAKYPQYQNIEDNELADKILEKYPVYQSQITEKQSALSKFASNVKSKITGRTSGLKESAETALDKGTFGAGARLAVRTGGAVAGSIGDILFEGLKVVSPDRLEELAKQGLGKAMATDPAQKVIGSITEWADRNPESAKDLQDILEIAGVVPVLKGAQVGVKTGVQTARTAGRAGIQAGERALTGGKQILGKTLATTGAVGEKAGKSLVSASFPPTASQARSLISYKAKTPLLQRVQLAAKSAEKAPITPAEVAIKYNLVGLSRSEIGARAKRITNQLFENQVKPVIEGIDKKVAIKDIFNQVKKEIAKTADTSKKKSLLNALESLQDDYKNVSNLSYKRLDKIKSEMAKSLPAKVWKGQDIAGEINNIRKMFSDKARVLIRKELPDNVKRIYDEYGSLLSIVEKGEKSLQRSLDVGILGLTSEAIRRAGTPLTTIGGKLVSEAGTLTKRLGQKLLPKKPKPLPKPKGEILKSTPKTTPLKSIDDNLVQEAKKYKSADEFIKAQSLYHGTPAKLEGNKLSFGKGDIKKGGQSGGLFLTDNSNSAKTFAFGGEIYQATPSIKNQVIDLTKKEGINKFKEFIGKSYKTMDGDMVTFDKYSFDNMFPNGKADFASISQFPELVEKIVKENKLKGIAFNEYAGGEIGKTYQILSGDIPVYTKSQLTDIWNKAQKLLLKK
jgi:hypothetical protein